MKPFKESIDIVKALRSGKVGKGYWKFSRWKEDFGIAFYALEQRGEGTLSMIMLPGEFGKDKQKEALSKLEKAIRSLKGTYYKSSHVLVFEFLRSDPLRSLIESFRISPSPKGVGDAAVMERIIRSLGIDKKKIVYR